MSTIDHYMTCHDVMFQHLCHSGHVKDILPVVLLGEIDVVEEEREVLEHPLGEVEVDGRALQEAHVEDSLPDASTVFNLYLTVSKCDFIKLCSRASLTATF